MCEAYDFGGHRSSKFGELKCMRTNPGLMKVGNFLYAFNNSEQEQVERINLADSGSNFELVTIRGIELLQGISALTFTPPGDSKALIFCGQNKKFDERFNDLKDVAVSKKVL